MIASSLDSHFADIRQHKQGKGFPYLLPSVEPGADPGVQAVSPQVSIVIHSIFSPYDIMNCLPVFVLMLQTVSKCRSVLCLVSSLNIVLLLSYSVS